MTREISRRLLFILLLGVAAIPAFGQIILSGSIIDAETGEGLPAANIRISGTFTGTISNADGAFRLAIQRIPSTIVVRYIGYQSDSLVVDRRPDAPVTIRLRPSVIEMDELVVTGENRAIEIMRRVIARKQRMSSSLERYRVDAYNRFTLSNDSGVVSVMETVTDAYWDKDRGTREVVKMSRKTNNADFGQLPAAMLVSNLYADNVEISGFEFVGVTSPRALSVYDFEIEGMRMRDDELLYDIAVNPKNPALVAFVGRITIDDEESVMIEAELRPGKSFRFPLPVRAFTVSMRQQYDVFGDSLWLPVDFRAISEIQIGVARMFEIPRIKIDQVSRLQNYKVNVELPADLFDDDSTVRTDTASVRANRVIPDSLSVPLVAAETQAYNTIDSTMTLDQAYKPTGFFGRKVQVSFGSGNRNSNSTDSSGASKRMRPETSIGPIALFNRVDGFKLGVRPSIRIGVVTVSGGVAYSTALADDHWSTEAGVTIGDDTRIGLNWYDRSERTFNSITNPQPVNTVFTLLGGADYFDYYRRNGIEVSLSHSLSTKWLTKTSRWDARASLSFRRERQEALVASTSYDLLGGDRMQRANAPILAGDLRSVVLGFAINPSDTPIAITGQRSFYVDVESTPDFLGGDFDFTSIRVRADWTLETFGQRRLFPNTLDVRLVASTFVGSLPPQRLGVLDVSPEPHAMFGSFRASGDLPYRGEETAAVFWEHNFRTIPFELAGLSALADRGYGITIFGGHGVFRTAGIAQQHHELGASLTGILGILRLDAAKRLDANGYGFGVGLARLF